MTLLGTVWPKMTITLKEIKFYSHEMGQQILQSSGKTGPPEGFLARDHYISCVVTRHLRKETLCRYEISTSQLRRSTSQLWLMHEVNNRRTRPELFWKIGVLKNSVKFKRKHLHWSYFCLKACNFIKKRLCGTGDFLWILRYS